MKRKATDNDNLEVYVFEGNEDEVVPKTVDKLIVNPGVQVLPNSLCNRYRRLREVTLPKDGLKRIGDSCFRWCTELEEIDIGSTVQHIGNGAFLDCRNLKKVGFGESATTPPQLQTIDDSAFARCRLIRIKLFSSVHKIDGSAFWSCTHLKEANLSNTRISEISTRAFCCCSTLTVVSLPNTLECIYVQAFWGCESLVTVVVPLDSQPIGIGLSAFGGCQVLANMKLPKGSTAEEDSSFEGCTALLERFGPDIVAGLIGRFDDHPIHRLCYDHSGVTALKLRQCIEEQKEYPFVDAFGMTPFHILFSTADPSLELLKELLEHYSSPKFLEGRDGLKRRDGVNGCGKIGKRAIEYLAQNASDATETLLEPTLQKSVIDPLLLWGAKSWTEAMEVHVRNLISSLPLSVDITEPIDRIYYAFEKYEKMESTSILELVLWKTKYVSALENGRRYGHALDRSECRSVCGSDVVIPNVTAFLWK